MNLANSTNFSDFLALSTTFKSYIEITSRRPYTDQVKQNHVSWDRRPKPARESSLPRLESSSIAGLRNVWFIPDAWTQHTGSSDPVGALRALEVPETHASGATGLQKIPGSCVKTHVSCSGEEGSRVLSLYPHTPGMSETHRWKSKLHSSQHRQ